MSEMQDREKWLDAQIDAAGQLVQLGSNALRQGQTRRGEEALAEAEAILDMAEIETNRLNKMRARVFNELGVVHQRRNDLEKSRHYHHEAARICDALIEDGEDFAANSAATNLNLSSIELAMGNTDEALACGEKALDLLDQLDGEERKGGSEPLELGARQNLAVIYARREDWERADEVMERARQLADQLADDGRPSFQAQLAQGCQQLSVILFDNEHFESALKWGRQAEELSERAYEAMGRGVLPVYIISQINLISYYEKLGQFADAEDCLWKALDVAGDDPRILERGVMFYETCRKQADARLEAGNLPREEVQQGLDDLMEKIDKVGGLDKVREAAKQVRQRARR